MSTNCSYFSSSIDPSNLKRITNSKDVSNLLTCLENDSNEYLRSLSIVDDRFKNQYDAIINILVAVSLNEPFIKTTNKFFELSNIKSGSFEVTIVNLFSDYIKDIAHRKFLCEKEIGRSFPLTEDVWVNLNKSDKKIVELFEKGQKKLLDKFITQLTGCIGNAFFSFEHSCRVITGYICLRSAFKMAKELPIQHKEVWKTLKKLGDEKNNVDCIACIRNTSCNYHYDFKLLANIYAYAITVRMLWDYSKMLYDDQTNWSQLVTSFFSSLESIIIGHEEIILNCRLGGL